MTLIRAFNKKSNNQRWWFIRHAPVIGYTGRIYGGRDVDCDVSMSDIYLRLAKILPVPEKVYTSTLLRTYKTASEIFKQAEIIDKQFPKIIKRAKLAEQSFGQWEGRKFSEIYNSNDNEESITSFAQITARMQPPEGESFIDVMSRTVEEFNNILKENESEKNIVFVVHAGTIRSALSSFMKIDPEKCQSIFIDNLGLSVFERINQPAGIHWNNLCINFTV